MILQMMQMIVQKLYIKCNKLSITLHYVTDCQIYIKNRFTLTMQNPIESSNLQTIAFLKNSTLYVEFFLHTM